MYKAYQMENCIGSLVEVMESVLTVIMVVDMSHVLQEQPKLSI